MSLDKFVDSKLELNGNIKIKITYNDKPVLIKIDQKKIHVESMGTVMLWNFTSPMLAKIQEFEDIVCQKLITEKEKFFEQQRKLFVTEDDVKYLWANAISNQKFRSFVEPGDTDNLTKLGNYDEKTQSWDLENRTVYAKASHIWITKKKCGIIWAVIVK